MVVRTGGGLLRLPKKRSRVGTAPTLESVTNFEFRGIVVFLAHKRFANWQNFSAKHGVSDLSERNIERENSSSNADAAA